MRRFSVRSAITLKGRAFKGLRGWAGKPFHPPLTDFPIPAYVLAAAFDISPSSVATTRVGDATSGTQAPTRSSEAPSCRCSPR